MSRFRPFVALSILALLAGCTSGSSGSRHTLYDSPGLPATVSPDELD